MTGAIQKLMGILLSYKAFLGRNFVCIQYGAVGVNPLLKVELLSTGQLKSTLLGDTGSMITGIDGEVTYNDERTGMFHRVDLYKLLLPRVKQ